MVRIPSKWPYRPSGISAVPDFSLIYRPPGYLLLCEAVKNCGEGRFSNTWTGLELAARHLGQIKFGPDRGAVTYIPRRRGRGPRWRVTTTLGERYVETEGEAQALWTEEKPELLRMFRNEKEARARLDQSILAVRQALNSGALKSDAHRLEIGDTVPIPHHVWGREDIPGVFELGGYMPSWNNPNIIEFFHTYENGVALNVKGRALISSSDFMSWLSCIDTREGLTDLSENTGSRKRGPKPKKTTLIANQMLAQLRIGAVAKESLQSTTEEALAAEYNASRDTCRKARKQALSLFVGVTNDLNSHK